MIKRALRKPRKEPKVGLTLRLDEKEFGFLHEVKDKRGCYISSYIRFLIHRATYEDSRPKGKHLQNKMEKVILLMKERKLTKTYRLIVTKSEHEELLRVKNELGISVNHYIRWLIRRRMAEYDHLDGELFEMV